MVSGNGKLAALRAQTADSAARKRLELLYDNGQFNELDEFAMAGDSLCGVIAAYGFVEGSPVYAFSQDKNIKSGAVGKAHAAKICKVMQLAAKTGVPVVGIHDSNGAFLDGGVDALTAYSEMLACASEISGVVPQISVIAGTCAGTAAMIACSSDFVIMSKSGEFFMTPPFDTKNSAASGADNAAAAGVAALVCEDDTEAVLAARKLISVLPANNLSPVPVYEFAEGTAPFNNNAEETVLSISDQYSTKELYAGFGSASYTALGTVNGATVGFVATNKNAEKLSGDDCAKIAKFVRVCDAFSIPVITVIDSEGFESVASSEVAGDIRNMSRLANAYAEATTVKISVVTGKAYGAVFTALSGKNGSSDMVFAFENAVITPLAPLTAVEFLHHDLLKGADDVNAKRNELAAEYAANEASALAAAQKGAVDSVILPTEIRARIAEALEILAGKRVNKLPKKHSNSAF